MIGKKGMPNIDSMAGRKGLSHKQTIYFALKILKIKQNKLKLVSCVIETKQNEQPL